MRKALTATLAALWTAWAAPVQAAWLEASSAHFVIDANTTEARLREFAANLERFDSALRATYNVPDDPARHANRVRVYAVSGETIQRLSGSGEIAGYYLARAGRSVILTSALALPKNGDLQLGSHLVRHASYDLDAQSTLLHEYSHHFMYVNFPRAYPLWFSEGFAEFNGNARFEDDGAVLLGVAPAYRAMGLLGSAPFPITDLFDPPKRRLANIHDVDQLYGRGWLLTHYLMLERRKQKELSAYIDKFNAGVPSVDAARASFGDLDALSTQMDALLAAGHLNGMRIPASTIGIIDLAPLSAGAAAMMTVRLQSESGVTATEAVAVAAQAEKIASAYPSDPRVQAELAEAEFDADHLDLADAAADRALNVDQKKMDALLFKGRVATRRLQTAGSRNAAQWAAARHWFVLANNGLPDAAEPLLLYYDSFEAEGVTPPATAYRSLIRAQQLASEDGTIRVQLARHMIAEGKLDDASVMLRPIAFSPHADTRTERARNALDALNSDHREKAQRILRARDDAS